MNNNDIIHFNGKLRNIITNFLMGLLINLGVVEVPLEDWLDGELF